MEGFIDLKKEKKTDNVAELPLQLAPPELSHGLELPHKQATPDLFLKSKRTFQDDGPSVLHASRIFPYEDPLKKLYLPFSKTEPVDYFIPGSVAYTTPEGVKQMLHVNGPLSGVHGCLLHENYLPRVGRYNREVNYSVDKTLGQGANGRAELCHDLHSKQPFVRKEISKVSLRHSEVLAPLNLNHENITKIFGLIQREEPMVGLRMELLLEYGGTALCNYLRDRSLTVKQIWELTGQGLSALKALYDSGIVHFDIKPENLVIMWTGSQLTLKVTDFGSAKLPQDPVAFNGVTFEYMAPESCMLALQTFSGAKFNPMITQSDMTGKLDVFAFALVVMYMYKRYHILVKFITEGNTSYRGCTDKQRQALQLNLMGTLAAQEDLIQSLVPEECGPDMRELLVQMTQHNIRDRLSAQQALLVVKERELKRKQMVPIMPQKKESTSTAAKFDELPDFQWPALNPTGNIPIPAIALNQTGIERGPIKNMRKDKPWRMPQKPYISNARGKDGRWHGKHMASKTLRQTPVQEMEKLSLTCGQESRPTIQKNETIGKFVTQPTDADVLDNTEQTPGTVEPESSGSQIINLDQWQRRVERTVDVPDLTCQPGEAMDCLEYDGKNGSYRQERQEDDKVVSLAKSNSASSVAKNAAGEFQKQLAAVFDDEPEIIFGNTDARSVTVSSMKSTLEVDIQPEPAAMPGGNLPNFALL